MAKKKVVEKDVNEEVEKNKVEVKEMTRGGRKGRGEEEEH